MSRQYMKQIQALEGNKYTTAYAALMSYCVGKGTLFNTKRRVILQALRSVHPDDYTSYVINIVVNTVNASGSSIFDISPASKLAAIFYVINENEKNLDETTTRVSVQNIIKLDDARKEETVVKLLKRYSALWIVRLFTGELGNAHVKEVRALLKQYRAHRLSYEELMTTIGEINTEEGDPLQALKPLIGAIEHQTSNENDEDEDNQSTSQNTSENPKEISENEKAKSSSSQKEDTKKEPELDQASIDAHKRDIEDIKAKLKSLAGDIDYISKHRNKKIMDIFWGPNSALELLDECNVLKSQLEECLNLTPAEYYANAYENPVAHVNLIDSNHPTYAKIEQFRGQCDPFNIHCDKENKDLKILLQTLVSFFDLFDLDCDPQVGESHKKHYRDLKKQYLKKFNEYQQREMTSDDDVTERKVFHDDMATVFRKQFVLGDWQAFPQLNEHIKKVRSLASQIMEKINASANTDEIDPLFKECKTEQEAMTILNSQACQSRSLFTNDTQVPYKSGVLKSVARTGVVNREEQHQKELLQKRDKLLAERADERRREVERLSLEEQKRQNERLEKENRHREKEAKQRQLLLERKKAENEARLKKEEERKLQQIDQEKRAEELRAKEEARRNEEKRAREEKERIELAQQQEKKSKIIKEKKALLKEVLLQCLTYLSMSHQQLGVSEAEYDKSILPTKKALNESAKAMLELEDEAKIDANITSLKKLLCMLDTAYSKHQVTLEHNRKSLQAKQGEIHQYCAFYTQHNFNQQLPVCKALDLSNVQVSLRACITKIENLLALEDDPFHDAWQKGIDFSEVIAAQKAFAAQYQKELREEPLRQKSLQSINERVRKTHEKIRELSGLLDTPLNYLKITDEQLKKKKQACSDLVESIKKYNPESIQDLSIVELRKLEEEISKCDVLIQNIGLDAEGNNLRTNCQSVVSEITNKIDALMFLVEGKKHYYAPNCLREDVTNLSYHQSKKISGLDVMKLLEDTENLRKEAAVLIESFKLLPSKLAFENLSRLADLEALTSKIHIQHGLNQQFISGCDELMSDYQEKIWQLEMTYKFVDSVFQLLLLEKLATQNDQDEVTNAFIATMEAFVATREQYLAVRKIIPRSHDDLGKIPETSEELMVQYNSLLINAHFPELREHILCVCSIAKKLVEDYDNDYFIKPLFDDCPTEWEIRVKLNAFAKEAGILFRKDMDILGGGFLGPQDPPISPLMNMNINYVQDNSQEKAEEARRARQAEEERRQREEQRRREEELRMIILRHMKQIVLDTVKRAQDSWNIDYTDTQLEEKIEAIFTERHFARDSVKVIADSVISTLNQVHQRVVQYQVYYNY